MPFAGRYKPFTAASDGCAGLAAEAPLRRELLSRRVPGLWRVSAVRASQPPGLPDQQWLSTSGASHPPALLGCLFFSAARVSQPSALLGRPPFSATRFSTRLRFSAARVSRPPVLLGRLRFSTGAGNVLRSYDRLTQTRPFASQNRVSSDRGCVERPSLRKAIVPAQSDRRCVKRETQGPRRLLPAPVGDVLRRQ